MLKKLRNYFNFNLIYVRCYLYSVVKLSIISYDNCFMIDKIVNLISGRSITDICRHETGGLGVDCVIDNGGKCIYMYQGL